MLGSCSIASDNTIGKSYFQDVSFYNKSQLTLRDGYQSTRNTVKSSHGHLVTSEHYTKPPAVIIYTPVRYDQCSTSTANEQTSRRSHAMPCSWGHTKKCDQCVQCDRPVFTIIWGRGKTPPQIPPLIALLVPGRPT